MNDINKVMASTDGYLPEPTAALRAGLRRSSDSSGCSAASGSKEFSLHSILGSSFSWKRVERHEHLHHKWVMQQSFSNHKELSESTSKPQLMGQNLLFVECFGFVLTLSTVLLSPLVWVEYEEELVFTEVLWHPEWLDLCKAVSKHLANAWLSYKNSGLVCNPADSHYCTDMRPHTLIPSN